MCTAVRQENIENGHKNWGKRLYNKIFPDTKWKK
jgi:hypothetical protein